ncbi:hypothetical protein ACH5RR_030095 [Cinchona calisaya]|uniref:Uncharacterized protein n=1 Tax=Cinchona calisaya TaxID=153742 RepID=A0ABD2YV13_9GENT
MSNKDFANMDKKGKSGIVLNLSDKDLWEVASEIMAKRMWDKLKDLYMKKTVVNRFYHKQSLYMLRMIQVQVNADKTLEPEPKEEEYFIARDRPRREIRLPQSPKDLKLKEKKTMFAC